MTNYTLTLATLTTLHDVSRSLALMERSEIEILPDGGLPRDAWRLLHKHILADRLTHEPRGEPDVPVLSWLYRSLGVGGFVGVVNGRFRLSRTAHDWLAQTAPAQVAALRQIWLAMPEVAWAWLPKSTGSWTRTHAWPELTRQLVNTLASLPVDSWIPATDVLTDLAAQAETLEYGVARNLPSVRQALAQQAARLTACQLGQLLPRLGLVCIKGEGAEQCVAVPPEAASWLKDARKRGRNAPTPTPEGTLQADCDPGPGWEITPDLRLVVPPELPAAATFATLQFADLLTLGPPPEYRLTRASMERATSHGWNLADILFELASGADAPVPDPVTAQLKAWQEEGKTVQYEPGYRLLPPEPAGMAALRAREPFRRVTELAASGAWAFVSHQDVAALFRYLRRCGYLLRPGAGNQPDPQWLPPLAPLTHVRLPLIPLAGLVGTYTLLQGRVPGLADLDTADLENALLVALSPHARAAAARLVASNDALINEYLGLVHAAWDASSPPRVQPVAVQPRLPADPATLPRLKDALTAAIEGSASVEIRYADTRGAVTQRRVRPLRLEERWGRRYLVAHCELRGDERSFRLDRIVEIRRS